MTPVYLTVILISTMGVSVSHTPFETEHSCEAEGKRIECTLEGVDVVELKWWCAPTNVK